MVFEPYCVQPLVGLVPAQNAELVIGGAGIQSMFQPFSVARLGVMGRNGWYTYTRKAVALIEYNDDPPVAVQCFSTLPARLLEMIGGCVKPHPERST